MERIHRIALFALYQITLLCGIVLLPLALVTKQFGFRLPIDRAVRGIKKRYEQTTV